MRIAMVGTDYVGLVSGVCLAELGHKVICVGKDLDSIQSLNQGIVPFVEPCLKDLTNNNLSHQRLSFTSNLAEATRDADIVFLTAGTPSRRGDGHADLAYIYDIAEEMVQYIENYTVVAIKSTVPVGTTTKVAEIIRSVNPRAPFDIVSNPAFIREGSAIHDFLNPKRVVIGSHSDHASAIMRELYQTLNQVETNLVFTSLQSAEIVNYASHAFIATKMAFINEMADLCEKTGASIQEVAQALSFDEHVGPKYLHVGAGYGGSSLPKDSRAIMRTGKEFGAPLTILRSVVASNDKRKTNMAEKITKACGGSVDGKILAILGVTFAPNTDDIRESPSLDIILGLHSPTTKLQVYDPHGINEARKLLPGVKWCTDAYKAMENADALVIMTAWNEFKSLDFPRVRALLKRPMIIDLCNIYEPENMHQAEFDYVSIGRRSVFGASTIDITRKFGT